MSSSTALCQCLYQLPNNWQVFTMKKLYIYIKFVLTASERTLLQKSIQCVEKYSALVGVKCDTEKFAACSRERQFSQPGFTADTIDSVTQFHNKKTTQITPGAQSALLLSVCVLRMFQKTYILTKNRFHLVLAQLASYIFWFKIIPCKCSCMQQRWASSSKC